MLLPDSLIAAIRCFLVYQQGCRYITNLNMFVTHNYNVAHIKWLQTKLAC